MPPLRCVIIGSSPIAVKLAELSAGTGFETHFYAPDAENLPALPAGVRVHSLLPGNAFPADRWTAAVLAFHDHEKSFRCSGTCSRGHASSSPPSAAGGRMRRGGPRSNRPASSRNRAHPKPRRPHSRTEIRAAGGRVDPGAGRRRRPRAAHRGLSAAGCPRLRRTTRPTACAPPVLAIGIRRVFTRKAGRWRRRVAQGWSAAARSQRDSTAPPARPHKLRPIVTQPSSLSVSACRSPSAPSALPRFICDAAQSWAPARA